jgi:tetratricopeptide (TPR) repeat protein
MSQETSDRLRRAHQLFVEAYRLHMAGDVDAAIARYQESIASRPTAEAHTFLGWALSFIDRLDDAIAECKKAIAVDPDFGNPYNDIGSYLLKQGKLDDAIPWLEQAINAKRYEPRHYPHCNLGRIYWAKGMLNRAISELERALELEPTSRFAQGALAAIRQQLH